ncbi:MAG: energy-coupling factor ABC transporter ATP-binding protein [Candidatus Wukongarchaeota archaeon]|nr:ABC transporter ATP-binding protein [Candidatus Wukongarchaeota archaeon]
MRNVITYDGVDFAYHKDEYVLKKVAFSVEQGEKLAIMGPNGAGKTTLFKLAVGLIKPLSGKVSVLGIDVTKKENLKKIRQKVGYLFQNPDDQIFATTVWEDVAFGPRNLGLNEEEVREAVETVLKEVLMENYGKNSPFHLSEGQKKRVAIAGLLAMEPEILLLDEPTSDLDIPTAKTFLEKISELNRKGVTVLMATHHIFFAKKWAQECIVLNNGSIIYQGASKEAFKKEEVVKVIGDPDYFL